MFYNHVFILYVLLINAQSNFFPWVLLFTWLMTCFHWVTLIKLFEKKMKPNLPAVDVIYLRTYPGVFTFQIWCCAAEPCGGLWALSASPLTQICNRPAWPSYGAAWERNSFNQPDKKKKKRSHYSGNLCGSEINSGGRLPVWSSTLNYRAKKWVGTTFELQLVRNVQSLPK